MKEVTYLLMRGLPGSGKSTFSKDWISRPENKGKWKRINKDTMREMLDLNDWSPENEALLNQVVVHMVRHYLRAGFNVISDNMNLDKQHFRAARRISRQLAEEGIQVTVTKHDILTPVAECIERDSKRPEPVTALVIAKLYNQYMPDGDMPNVDAYLGWHLPMKGVED